MESESLAVARPSPASEKRSVLVSVIAWLGLLGNGFGSVGLLLMAVLLGGEFAKLGQTAMHDSKMAEMPAWARFYFLHIREILGFASGWCLFGTYYSWSLLRRKNWARILMVALLVLGSVVQIASLVYSLVSPPVMPSVPNPPPNLEAMQKGMTSANVILSLLVLAFNAWLIKKFTSGPIRREFAQS